MKLCKIFFAGALIVIVTTSCTFNPPEALNLPEYNLAGDRFTPEPVQTVGLKASDVFWLADSELVSVNWQSFGLTYSFPDASCDLCGSSQVTFDGDADGWFVQCGSKRRAIISLPEVRLIELDLPVSDVYRIRRKIKYNDGCANANLIPEAFLPGGRTLYSNAFLADRDAQYKLYAVVPFRLDEVESTNELEGIAGEAQLETYVVHAGLPKSVPPQTLTLSAEVWEWQVGEENGKWQINFSHRLRVTKVRVLQGRRHANNRFIPANPINPYVVPQRLEFGAQSCYADRNAADGDIDLRRCRQSSNAVNGADIIATPTYLNTADQSPLNWRVVFDSAAGFPAPMLGNGEELAIEFVVERR